MTTTLTKPTTRTDRNLRRLERELALMRQRRADALCRGDYAGAMAISSKLNAKETEIEDYHRLYDPQPLGDIISLKELDRHRINARLIEIHLAADYLADCCMEIRDELKKLGVADCEIYHIADDIGARAQRFANAICHPQFGGLTDFMVNNDELIDELHQASARYMDSRLNFPNPSNNENKEEEKQD